jgi:hypothetical protein
MAAKAIIVHFISFAAITFYLIPFTVNRWDNKFRTGIAIIAVFACHSIIKCLSDGDPFAYDFLISLGVLSVLINSQNPEEVMLFLKKRVKVFFWAAFLILVVRHFHKTRD